MQHAQVAKQNTNSHLKGPGKVKEVDDSSGVHNAPAAFVASRIHSKAVIRRVVIVQGGCWTSKIQTAH